jgi:serine/threonine-protein phosphatase 2A regulatory subunit A
LVGLVNDPIPNIRFNVAKSLEVLATTLNATPEGQKLSQTQIIPAVETLRNDSDADVRYFANKALEKALQTGAVVV